MNAAEQAWSHVRELRELMDANDDVTEAGDGAITKELLWLGMHRVYHPRCPIRDASLVNANRPVTECVIETTARAVPPAIAP